MFAFRRLSGHTLSLPLPPIMDAARAAVVAAWEEVAKVRGQQGLGVVGEWLIMPGSTLHFTLPESTSPPQGEQGGDPSREGDI